MMTTKNFTRVVIRAAGLGMSQEVRSAWLQLDHALKKGPVSLLGSPGPNRYLLARARCHGALPASPDDESVPSRTVVVPMCGMSHTLKRRWQNRGCNLLDLSLPAVRSLYAMKSMMKAEQRHLIIVGFRGSQECEALTEDMSEASVVSSVDQVSRLPFAPRFGIICETGVSRRRFDTICTSMHLKYRDSDIQTFDTRSSEMMQREKAVHDLVGNCDMVVVLADDEDKSGQALYEAARWHGCTSMICNDAEGPLPKIPAHVQKIGISAGIHTTNEEIDLFTKRLATA